MAHNRSVSDDTDDDPLTHLRPLSQPTWHERLDDLRDRLVVSPIRSGAVALAALLTFGSLWWLFGPSEATPIEAAIPRAGAQVRSEHAGANRSGGGSAESTTGDTTAATATTVPGVVVVQAAGAVNAPGVYRLRAGSRVDDLVAAAGGLSADADVDRTNLAALLLDGERVWIPRRGDEHAPEVIAGSGSPTGAAATGAGGTTGGAVGGTASTAPTGPIDINNANAEELDRLPGVGPSTAAAILAYRAQHGRFGSVDELLEVRGIGEAKLEQIRPFAIVR